MTALANVTPAIEVEPESVTISWTPIGAADQYSLAIYAQDPADADYDNKETAGLLPGGANPIVYASGFAVANLAGLKTAVGGPYTTAAIDAATIAAKSGDSLLIAYATGSDTIVLTADLNIGDTTVHFTSKSPTADWADEQPIVLAKAASKVIPMQSSGNATGLRTGVSYKATLVAHVTVSALTDSTEVLSTAKTTVGALQAAAGTSGEVAHRTTNEFTGAAYLSPTQTKGQVTYARVNGIPVATVVDGTTSEGATVAARDTADLPSGDMQQTIHRDEGDSGTAGTGGGDLGGGVILVSDIIVTPTDLTANSSVLVNPVTGAMTPITGTEQVTRGFDANTVRVDRTLREIDHTKNYVDKSGVAH